MVSLLKGNCKSILVYGRFVPIFLASLFFFGESEVYRKRKLNIPNKTTYRLIFSDKSGKMELCFVI